MSSDGPIVVDGIWIVSWGLTSHTRLNLSLKVRILGMDEGITGK